MKKKDYIKDQVLGDIHRKENVILEMNAVNNETDNTSKQSSNNCMKTSATESKYGKLKNRQSQIENTDSIKEIEIDRMEENIIREIAKETNTDMKDRVPLKN